MSEDPVTIIREIPQPSTGGSSPNPGSNPLPLPAQLGELWLAAKSKPTAVVTRIWMESPPTPSESGAGGWTVTPEEGSKGTVEYTGVEPDRWTIPVIQDGWADHRDVQGDWTALRALSLQQGSAPPPEIWLSGALPPDLLSRTWLIEKLVPGEGRLIGGERGERLLRARATIYLIEPVYPTNIASPIKQAQAKGGSKSSRKSKPARKGDTLVKIAARELGDPERWREISKLNHNRQPDNVKAGERFRLP